MIDLGRCAGFPVRLDPRALTLEFPRGITTAPVTIRRLDEVRSRLRDPRPTGPDHLYTIYTDIRVPDRAAPDVEDVIVVEAGPGDKVVIPPGWAHGTVNLGDEPMAFGAVYALEARLLYEPLRELQGTAHYVLADGTLEPNPRYRTVPQARRQAPHEIPEHGIGHGRPALSGELDLLDLVSRPERHPAVWERLVARV